MSGGVGDGEQVRNSCTGALQMVKGGRDRKRPPPEWTGVVVGWGDETQANPGLT